VSDQWVILLAGTITATQKRLSNHLINKWTTGKPTAKVLMEHGHQTAACVLRWLVGWGLTALLTQNRSYRACRFVSCVIIKLGDVTALTKQVKRTWHWQCLTVSEKSQHVFIFCKKKHNIEDRLLHRDPEKNVHLFIFPITLSKIKVLRPTRHKIPVGLSETFFQTNLLA